MKTTRLTICLEKKVFISSNSNLRLIVMFIFLLFQHMFDQQNFFLPLSKYRNFLCKNKVGKPTSTPPSPQSLRGAVPLCAPPQHRLAVYYLITACASLAERLCNRKGLSRISVTRSFLLHKKEAPQPVRLRGFPTQGEDKYSTFLS